MKKLPKPIPPCPKCGANAFAVYKCHKDGSETFERYGCIFCNYKWKPDSKEKVVFT